MLPEKNKLYIISLLIISFLAYSGFIYKSLPFRNSVISEESSHGKILWQQYNCTACHQVYGLGGYLGPDLTNTFSKKGPAYISAFLKSGTVIMPNFNLDQNEITALIAYLKSIDKTGSADPRTFTKNYDGTIEQ